MTSKKTKAPVKAAPKAKKAGASAPSKSSSPKSKAALAPKAKIVPKPAVMAKPAAKQAVKTAKAAKAVTPAKSKTKAKVAVSGKPSIAAKAVMTGKATVAAPAKKPLAPSKGTSAAKSSVPVKVLPQVRPQDAKKPVHPSAAKPVAATLPAKAGGKTIVSKPASKPIPPPPPPPPPKKPGKGLNAQQAERMKQLLLDRRSSLMDRKSNTELAAEDLGDTGGDSADRAAVSVDRDFMAESQARDAKMLQDIDEALGKISAGSYGICEECRCTIAIKRLEYLPNVAYCIECQEKLEEQGLYNDNSGGGPEDFRNVE